MSHDTSKLDRDFYITNSEGDFLWYDKHVAKMSHNSSKLDRDF